MTKITIKTRLKGDPPIDFVPPSGATVHVQDNLTLVLMEGGMQSGEPSVAILGVSPQGHGVFVETSLDKYLMGATGMMGLAKGQFGWKMPRGYGSLIPDGVHHEERRHVDALGGLGEECLRKHSCNQKHAIVVWREES